MDTPITSSIVVGTQQRTTLNPQPALVFRSGEDCTQRMNNLIKETSLQGRLPSHLAIRCQRVLLLLPRVNH